MKSPETARQDLLKIYQAALDSVSGRQAVAGALSGNSGPCSLLAIGKAAEAMALGAIDAMGDDITDGLLISKAGHFESLPHQHPRIACIEGAHPVPDERSLKAGERLLAYLSELPDSQPLVVLISGGASSLVEVLPEGIGIEQLQAVNEWMLATGLAIDEMNQIRKAISTIKGGGLIPYLGDRPVQLLLISDVPGDDPSIIGSGLLVPEQPSSLPAGIPDWILEIIQQSIVTGEQVRQDINPTIVACLKDARNAAAACAKSLGYAVTVSHAHIGGSVDIVGRRLALELIDGWPGVYIWGGEPVVHLPDNPGRGGRNQHLALTVAEVIAGYEELFFLSAGTDGGDGPGTDAGALVDGKTLFRGRAQGMDLDQSLKQADSGSFLEASDDLISTGPTGTNVMDIMIGLRL